MKHSILFAATAALALGACGKSDGPTPDATAAATEEAAPSAPSAAAASPSGTAAFTAGEAPSKAFMVGTWGEGAACEMKMTFAADGTIKDGPFAKWDIQDGHLVMEGAPQKMKLKVVDGNTMESQIDTDKPRTLKRC